jgi:hypothetical protein
MALNCFQGIHLGGVDGELEVCVCWFFLARCACMVNMFHVCCRYRMKVNVEDATGVAVFTLFDQLVQDLASEACDLLAGMVHCLFPVFCFIVCLMFFLSMIAGSMYVCLCMILRGEC